MCPAGPLAVPFPHRLRSPRIESAVRKFLFRFAVYIQIIHQYAWIYAKFSAELNLQIKAHNHAAGVTSTLRYTQARSHELCHAYIPIVTSSCDATFRPVDLNLITDSIEYKDEPLN